MAKKIALIGDIVSSQKIKNRAEIQKKLKALFKNINAKSGSIESPYTITLGDEFQAVYKNPESLFKNIWEILLAVYPEKIRFSIGIGELSTPINKKQAIGMDGPAFYSARNGLEEIKQTSYTINISGDKIPNENLLRQSLYLISFLSHGWKKTRLQIIKLMYDGLTVKKIAKKIKISDKAVYKNINAGALNVVINLTNEIESVINITQKQK